MSDHIVFNQILHLVGKGYTVNLSKVNESYSPAILRIDLSKDEHHHVELVDISIKTIAARNVTTDYVISSALSKAEWELDYYIEKEINGND